MNGKQCDVRQEGEHDDESMKVGLSFKDRVGGGNACSLYRGSSTPCSERLDHEGALMVKFKGKCAAIEQGAERSLFLSHGRSSDGRAGRYTWSSVARTHARTGGPTHGRSDIEKRV